MKGFKEELKRLIVKVYENEDLFIKRFGICYKNIESIDSFYMASYKCLVSFEYKDNLNTGGSLVVKKTLINTDEFLDWIESL